MDQEDNIQNAKEGNINIPAADFARLLSDGEIDIFILDMISSNFGLMSPSLLYAVSTYVINTEINKVKNDECNIQIHYVSRPWHT